MRKARRRVAAATAVTALLLCGGTWGGATSPGLVFDKVFAAAGEPPALHYQVMFVGSGGVHRMEVWRDHDRRIKRVTDRAIVSLATHRTGEAGYQLTILDLERRIATRIDRTNLYRVGNFTDWFDLGHGLRHPKGTYTLATRSPPPGMPNAPTACTWYQLTEGGHSSSICWDAQHRIPLLIATSDNQPIWRVLNMDVKPAAPNLFAIDIRGFTVNDANRDIEGD